jgi:hypothetical protein
MKVTPHEGREHHQMAGSNHPHLIRCPTSFELGAHYLELISHNDTSSKKGYGDASTPTRSFQLRTYPDHPRKAISLQARVFLKYSGMVAVGVLSTALLSDYSTFRHRGGGQPNEDRGLDSFFLGGYLVKKWTTLLTDGRDVASQRADPTKPVRFIVRLCGNPNADVYAGARRTTLFDLSRTESIAPRHRRRRLSPRIPQNTHRLIVEIQISHPHTSFRRDSRIAVGVRGRVRYFGCGADRSTHGREYEPSLQLLGWNAVGSGSKPSVGR